MQTLETYLQGKGFSPTTIDNHKKLVAAFTAWFGSEDIINCRKKDVLDYLHHLNGRGVQAVSRYNALIALRHYFDTLMDDSLMASNPAASIKLRGLKKRRLYYIYTPEELTELVDKYYLLEVKRAEEKRALPKRKKQHEKSYFAQMRNYVMLQFFVYQGISKREAADLRMDDLHLHRATVTIHGGTRKGNTRTLPLNAVQIGSLMQYINDIRPNLANADGDRLFLPAKHLVQSWQADDGAKAVEKLCQRLKHIDRKFNSPPQLRASVITSWIKNHGLRKAQYLAGHKCITSTEEYLPNYIEDLADDITKFNPF